jgi:hypothetical protein
MEKFKPIHVAVIFLEAPSQSHLLYVPTHGCGGLKSTRDSMRLVVMNSSLCVIGSKWKSEADVSLTLVDVYRGAE